MSNSKNVISMVTFYFNFSGPVIYSMFCHNKLPDIKKIYLSSTYRLIINLLSAEMFTTSFITFLIRAFVFILIQILFCTNFKASIFNTSCNRYIYSCMFDHILQEPQQVFELQYLLLGLIKKVKIPNSNISSANSGSSSFFEQSVP